LVICDLCLDGTDCHDLMQQWHGQQPSTPFILVTGADQIAEAVRAMQHGAADYITKPINPAELVVRVAKWLENSRKQQRLQQLESRFDGGDPHEGHNGSSIDIPAGTSGSVRGSCCCLATPHSSARGTKRSTAATVLARCRRLHMFAGLGRETRRLHGRKRRLA
jgi:hypothetical protein